MKRAAALIVVSVAAAAAHADAVDDAMKKAGCMGCHAVDRPMVGPSWKDIAAKRKGQADAAAMLMDKLRRGGPAVYGSVPKMPIGPDAINDADLRAMVERVLGS